MEPGARDRNGGGRQSPSPPSPTVPVLVLGVGNVLMGDEGVGVRVVTLLESMEPIPGIRLMDGGTGGVNLLEDIQTAKAVIMVDATRDGKAAGTVARLKPAAVGALPHGLSAHDFGLKDLFAASALLGTFPEIHLFTISVEEVKPMCLDLSPAVAASVPRVADEVRALAASLAAQAR
jgi:hydrogenase maturation protease